MSGNFLVASKSFFQQDYHALLKAEYCLRVAALSCTHKTHKNHVTLTFDLLFDLVLGWRNCSLYLFYTYVLRVTPLIDWLHIGQRLSGNGLECTTPVWAGWHQAREQLGHR